MDVEESREENRRDDVHPFEDLVRVVAQRGEAGPAEPRERYESGDS